MFEIKGTYTKAIVFADIIEEEATSQIYELCSHIAFKDANIRIMPDVHSGAGCVIGFTADLGEKVVPNLVGVDIGCVDKDTEFLSENGWVKISEYNNQKIAVFDYLKRETRYELPVAYIKDYNEEFYYLHTKYGINQMLSPEHKCLVEKGSHNRPKVRGQLYCISAKELYEKHSSLKLGFRDNFICDIPNLLIKTQCELSDEEIRVQVMVMADGHIQKNGKCLCQFRKNRKIERCQALLSEAGIKYEIKERKDDRFAVLFEPPIGEKRISVFKNCSIKQLWVICDEVMNWDGTIKDNVYTSVYKEDVDFIQYAFAVTGHRTSISYDGRENKESYRCIVSDSRPRTQLAGRPKTDIEIVKSVDGYKYCFTTTTGFWVMRRNGCICVTGNCGMLTTELGEIEIDFARLDEVIRKYVPSGRNVHEGRKVRFNLQEMHCYRELKDTKRLERSIGTLGGGNHFIECDIDPDTGCKYLIIHTGSRNLGKQVAEYYQKKAIESCSTRTKTFELQKALIEEYKANGKESEINAALRKLREESISNGVKIPKDLSYLIGMERGEYLHDMRICQEYAKLNRKAIADTIMRHMEWDGVDSFETIHNYIEHDKNIVRKGAISAKLGEQVLIPINMRDGCILAVGKGNEEWNLSAPHGAGRLMSRSKAKNTLSLDEYRAEMQGIYSSSVVASTLDEAPMAYKPLGSIISQITDTVEVKKVLNAIYNFKAQ